jgi:hypothetical protein
MAKEQKQEQTSAFAPDGTEALGPPRSYRLYIVLGFASLILFQMLMLYILLPGRTPAQINGGIRAGEGPGVFDDTNPVPADVGKRETLQEKPIGEKTTFKFKQTFDGTTASVSAVIHVKVLKADAYKFETEYTNRMAEIIDAVLKILRGAAVATSEDYQEIGNTALKEKVQKAINAVLPKPYVKQVFFTELNYEVQ